MTATAYYRGFASRNGLFGMQGIRRRFSKITPEEAGSRAEAIAAQRGKHKWSLPTICAHAGIEDIANAPMAPPIHIATTYTRPADGNYLPEDSTYARNDNPTRLLLERTVFQLETVGLDLDMGEIEPTSWAFSSGMMATSALILAHSTPLTIILPHDLYHGTTTAMVDVFSRHNVEVKRADMTDPQNIIDEISKLSTAQDVIVWMETPSNPKCQIIDIWAVVEAVEKLSRHRVTTAVDVTMASPIVTRPLEFGVDIAMHSGTKYLGGHSDALLGVLTASPKTQRGKELAPKLKTVQAYTGGVASPWDSWLSMRGIRTLQVRVERQSATAATLAKYLNDHNMVVAVHYPGLEGHPQHHIAKSQMSSFGGVFSMELQDEIVAMAFAAALRTMQRATSLGGTETLIEHRASIEPPERRTSPPGLLRVSVGLEDVEELINDVENALSVASMVVEE